ncbi:MAG: hypothetical protein ABI382_01010 [Nakamurella sp.]
MTQFGGEPEIWFEGHSEPAPTGDGSGGSGDGSGGSGDSNGGDGNSPRGPGWPRWTVVAIGILVLVAIIVTLRFLDEPADSAPAPKPEPPVNSSSSSAEATSGAATHTSAPTTTVAYLPEATDSVADSGSVSATDLPSPSTSTTAPADLPGSPFELTGLISDENLSSGVAIIRYDSNTGMLARTELPPLMSSGQLSFVATDGATIVRPWDGVPGYVAHDGKPAKIAEGLLGQGGPVYSAATPGLVWVTSFNEGSFQLDLVDSSGRTAGAAIKPPASLGVQSGWGLAQDGAGGVLAVAIGGTYDLRPGATQLVTHGVVLAAGPTGYLVYECDDAGRCTSWVVDRSTDHRSRLPAYQPTEAPAFVAVQGVISPNGRYAAIFDNNSGGTPINIVDLRTGKSEPINAPIDGQTISDAASLFAFTADSSYLLIAAADGVHVVNPATGSVLQTLPVPPLAAIAIRPAP